ncbi:hypothetical protein GP924_25115 [Enterobacteriaceae bacterium 8376wB9]|nr:hypothetical protein [Enterobacteriaceae bacterium 8376wB9]
MSPSGLEHIDATEWIDPTTDNPTQMLFSVMGDTSRGISLRLWSRRGSALSFLYAALAPKPDPGSHRKEGPKCITIDNGTAAKSRIFLDVMLLLGVNWQTHLPPL